MKAEQRPDLPRQKDGRTWLICWRVRLPHQPTSHTNHVRASTISLTLGCFASGSYCPDINVHQQEWVRSERLAALSSDDGDGRRRRSLSGGASRWTGRGLRSRWAGRSLSGRLAEGHLPPIGQQLRDAALGMILDPEQHVGEVRHGIDAGLLARRDQRIQHGESLAAAAMRTATTRRYPASATAR
jgi:hypothetical protein